MLQDLARIDTLKGQGRTCISVVRVQPYALPFNVTLPSLAVTLTDDCFATGSAVTLL